MRISSTLAIGAVGLFLAVGILLGVAIGTFVLADDTEEPLPDAVHVAVETEGYEDRIVYTLAPTTDEHRTYRVTYTVFEDGNQIDAVANESYELAAADPLTIEIGDRNPDARYRVDVTMWDEYDRVLFDGSIGVGPLQNYFVK